MDINISVPLDVSLKRRARARWTCTADRVAEAQYQDMAVNAIDTLYTVYVNAQEARERVKWAEEDVAALERLDRLARKRPDRGQETADELARIGNALRMARLRLMETRNKQAHAAVSLGMLLDLPVDEARDLVVEDLTRDPSANPGPEDLIRMAMAARPDLAALRLGLARSEADIKLAERAHADRVRAAGQDPADPRLDVDAGHAAHKLAVERARINVEQCRLQLRTLEDAVRRDLERSPDRYHSQIISMRSSWFRLKVALRHIADMQRQYEEGKATVHDVLAAREAVMALEPGYVTGLARVHREALSINTAVGVRLLP